MSLFIADCLMPSTTASPLASLRSAFTGIASIRSFYRVLPYNIPVNFPVSEVILLIASRDGAQDAAWIANGYGTSRDIFRDDTAGANDCVVANSHARENTSAGTDPAVATNAHRHVKLVGRRTAQLRKNRMPRCADHHIGTKFGVVPNVDMRVIYKRKIMVDIHMVSDVEETTTPVRKERGFNETFITNFCQHPAKKSRALLQFTRASLIEVVEKLHVHSLHAEKLFIQALIKRTVVQL